MAKLDFLTVVHTPENVATINRMAAEFLERTGHSIQGNYVGWNTLWRECTNAGIYNKGAHFAEIGSTWLEGLVSMNSLRPYSPYDIELLGGKDLFLAGSWSSASVGNSDQVWGIPMRSDARLLWFWKDMVEDAGLDPETAFSSMERLPETLETLQKITPTPWGVITNTIDANTTQVLASWIWQAGGDFVSSDGKKILFLEPEARQGIQAFFDLHRFMPKGGDRLLGGDEISQLFVDRKICATISGPWRLMDFQNKGFPVDRIGYAKIPGPAFVGGTLMVIYKHCRDVSAVIEWMKLLLQPENQATYSTMLGLLPTKRDAWEVERLASEPLYRVLRQAITEGRSYPSVPLWGGIENKLITAVANTWSALLSQEKPQVAQVINENFEPLGRRLQLTIDG